MLILYKISMGQPAGSKKFNNTCISLSVMVVKTDLCLCFQFVMQISDSVFVVHVILIIEAHREKNFLGVFVQVRHKLGCTAKKDG